MTFFLDSADVPTDGECAQARQAGAVGWGGYLSSPTAAHPWGAANLERVGRSLACLPIYVCPLVAGHEWSPVTAGKQVAAQVASMSGTWDLVGWDAEPCWTNPDPQGAARWLSQAIEVAGIPSIVYGVPSALAALPTSALLVGAWVASPSRGSGGQVDAASLGAAPTDDLAPSWARIRMRQWWADAYLGGAQVDVSTTNASSQPTFPKGTDMYLARCSAGPRVGEIVVVLPTPVGLRTQHVPSPPVLATLAPPLATVDLDEQAFGTLIDFAPPVS